MGENNRCQAPDRLGRAHGHTTTLGPKTVCITDIQISLSRITTNPVSVLFKASCHSPNPNR